MNLAYIHIYILFTYVCSFGSFKRIVYIPDHSKSKSYFFVVCKILISLDHSKETKQSIFVTIIGRSGSSGLAIKCGTARKPFSGGIRGSANTNTQKGGNCNKSNGASESHSSQLGKEWFCLQQSGCYL
jgi:hypothetical protein